MTAAEIKVFEYQFSLCSLSHSIPPKEEKVETCYFGTKKKKSQSQRNIS